jgi:hypothetical protein
MGRRCPPVILTVLETNGAATQASTKFPAKVLPLSLPKTLSGEDTPELGNRGMLAGDGYDSQAADRGATRLYDVARGLKRRCLFSAIT